MLAILNSLNTHNFPIFQPILTILVPKFMVQRALSDKRYLSLGLLSPLILPGPSGGVENLWQSVRFSKSPKGPDKR